MTSPSVKFDETTNTLTVANLPDTRKAGVALGAVILGRVLLSSGFPTHLAADLVKLYGFEAQVAMAEFEAKAAVTLTEAPASPAS